MQRKIVVSLDGYGNKTAFETEELYQICIFYIECSKTNRTKYQNRGAEKIPIFVAQR